MCEWRSVRICCYGSSHGGAIGSHLRPFHIVSEHQFSEARRYKVRGIGGGSDPTSSPGDSNCLQALDIGTYVAVICDLSGTRSDTYGCLERTLVPREYYA